MLWWRAEESRAAQVQVDEAHTHTRTTQSDIVRRRQPPAASCIGTFLVGGREACRLDPRLWFLHACRRSFPALQQTSIPDANRIVHLLQSSPTLSSPLHPTSLFSTRNLCAQCDLTSMTLDHASAPSSIGNNSMADLRQTLPPTSRELGEVLPPKLVDGAPVATQGAADSKSWAHFIAGGCAA